MKFQSSVKNVIKLTRSHQREKEPLTGLKFIKNINLDIACILKKLDLKFEYGFESPKSLAILNNAVFIINERIVKLTQFVKETVDTIFDLHETENLHIFKTRKSDVKVSTVERHLNVGGMFYEKFMNVAQLTNICQLILRHNLSKSSPWEFELCDGDSVSTETYLDDVDSDNGSVYHSIVINFVVNNQAVEEKHDEKTAEVDTCDDQYTTALDSRYYWTEAGLDLITKTGDTFDSGRWKSVFTEGFKLVGEEITDKDIKKYKELSLMEGDITARDLFIDKSISKVKGVPSENLPDQRSEFPADAMPILRKKSDIEYRQEFLTYYDNEDSELSPEESALKDGPASVFGMGLARFSQWQRLYQNMCDAPPILRILFMRDAAMMELDTFYRTGDDDTRIGMFNHLFKDVQKRDRTGDDLQISQYYTWLRQEQAFNTTDKWVDEHSAILIERVMIGIGLDTKDMSENHTTAVGLGNLVARRITEYMNTHDGLNQENNYLDPDQLRSLGIKHNDALTLPSSDAMKLKWQPTISSASRFRNLRRGVCTSQTLVFPSIGQTGELSMTSSKLSDQGDYKYPYPDEKKDIFEYVRHVKLLLDTTSGMDESKYMKAEYFNNKIYSITSLASAVLPYITDPGKVYELLYMLHCTAGYPAVYAAWKVKGKHMAPRPKTVMQMLVAAHDNEESTGIVHDACDKHDVSRDQMNNWHSALPDGDHSEFLSGSCAIYSAAANVLVKWMNYHNYEFGGSMTLDTPLDISWTYPKNSSDYKDNFPTEDVIIKYHTLGEMVADAVNARMYSGSHFRPSNIAGVKLGELVANEMFAKWECMQEGKNEMDDEQKTSTLFELNTEAYNDSNPVLQIIKTEELRDLDIANIIECDPKLTYYWTKKGLNYVGSCRWRQVFGSKFKNPGDKIDDIDIRKLKEFTLNTTKDLLLTHGYISKHSHSGRAMSEHMPPQKSGNPVDAEPILRRHSASSFFNEFSKYYANGNEVDALKEGPASVFGMGLSRFSQWERTFPGMCDTPPILRIFFMRDVSIMELDTFYRNGKDDKRVGMFKHLFTDVKKRDRTGNDLQISQYYTWLRQEQYFNTADKWVDEHSVILIERVMAAIGLDPNDMSNDPATPIGLGNIVAERITEYMNKNDGLSQENNYLDLGALRKLGANHNSPLTLPDSKGMKLRWQPTLSSASRFRNLRKGVCTTQSFVFPALATGDALCITGDLGFEGVFPYPTDKEHISEYVSHVKLLLETTSEMNESKYMKAEYFNNKIYSITSLALAVLPYIPDSGKVYELLYMLHCIAEYPAVHAAWKVKGKHMAPRPKTVMQMLVAAHDNEGSSGIVHDACDKHDVSRDQMDNWYNALPDGDHSEFLSGSCAIYSAAANVLVKWMNYHNYEFGGSMTLDTPLDISWTYPKNSSDYKDNFPTEDCSYPVFHLT